MMNIQRKILSMTMATYFQSSFTWEHRDERLIINIYLRLKLLKTISVLFQNRIFSSKFRERRERSLLPLQYYMMAKIYSASC